MHLSLHGFQREAVDQIEYEIARGVRRVLYVAPTGSGKTVVASEITRRAADRHRRVLFLAHRREIIDQTSRKLAANGIPLGLHGIVLAGRERDLRPQAMVQVASIDTLLARGVRSGTMRLPPADFIIFDETHRIRGRTREYLVSLYPDAVLLGLTATPCRGDGRGLGNIFETMIQAPQVAELIRLGFLVGARVFAPVDKDIAKGVRIEKGDYVVSALAARMNTTELVGDVVRDWLQHGERRRTVAFAVDVAHSVHIRDEFVRAGVRAEHLDGSTPLADREAILARLGTGETEVVSNCAVLTEGWDMPEVGCCILARPTKQLGLYRQMIGRVLRTAPGKRDAIILDHAGAWHRHGLPEDHVEWTLDVDARAENRTHEARKRGEALALRECPSCKQIMAAPPPCVHCGWEPRPRGRDVDFLDGELGLVSGGKAKPSEYSIDEKLDWYRMLVGEALRRGKKPGWAHYLFKDKFGHEISPADRTAMPPTPEVSRFVQSRIIAYAKSRRAAA
jgi:superfamily II DNA or RNA helicase